MALRGNEFESTGLDAPETGLPAWNSAWAQPGHKRRRSSDRRPSLSSKC